MSADGSGVAAAWRVAGRALTARAIGEFGYEELLVPEPDGDGGGEDRWRLELPGATYRFAARRGGFGAWRVDPESVTVAVGDGPPAPADDPVALLVAAREPLGLTGIALAASGVNSSAFDVAKPSRLLFSTMQGCPA